MLDDDVKFASSLRADLDVLRGEQPTKTCPQMPPINPDSNPIQLRILWKKGDAFWRKMRLPLLGDWRSLNGWRIDEQVDQLAASTTQRKPIISERSLLGAIRRYLPC